MRIEEFVYNRCYKIDENGNVYNLDGTIKKIQIADKRANTKYYSFGVKIDNRIYRCKVHRFQAYVKYKDLIYKEKICVRHLDGDSLNNSIDNIEIGSWTDNRLDIKKEIRMSLAKNATKRVTKYSKTLQKIISEDRIKNKLSYRDLEIKYSIPYSSIYGMINRYKYDS